MYAVVLAGGVGTRLWPRSRQTRPKQFADITDSGQTMIQATVARLAGLVNDDQVYVVTGATYAELACEQLPNVPPNQVLTEPFGRNTAPAIGLACIHLRRRDAQAVVAILPADHVIPLTQEFQSSLRRAARAAQAGHIVTLGIQPITPHTGYGYIQRGAELSDLSHDHEDGWLPVFTVRRFLEKPKRETAEAFLHEGGYYWNGGIFVGRVDVLLGEIESQLPEVYAGLQRIAAGLDGPDAAATMEAAWTQMPSVSIDYGVMEGAQHVAMVPLNAGWNDVGSWDALESIIDRDDNNNVTPHQNTFTIDSWGNLIFSSKRVVALIGVDDLVVVEDGDALLIGHKHQMQKVRDIVEQLRKRGHSDMI